MHERERPKDKADDGLVKADRGAHVIEPDSAPGRDITRAREH